MSKISEWQLCSNLNELDDQIQRFSIMVCIHMDKLSNGEETPSMSDPINEHPLSMSLQPSSEIDPLSVYTTTIELLLCLFEGKNVLFITIK